MARALGRFEAVMGTAWPRWFEELRAGLDDEALGRLRDAVAPYVVPAQVEALYRWRNGGDQGVFGGWRMRPLDELIEWYRFTRDEMESPGTWLPVFEDQIVNIVTLDLPGQPPSDLSVWYGHTHDKDVHRLFDSIAALLDAVCDASEAGALAEDGSRFGLRSGDYLESPDGAGWSEFRLSRSPGSFRWPEPPPGTYLSRFAEPDWPREWLVPLGVTDESLELRGATHSVAELVAAAAQGPVRGTIRGTVVTGSGGNGWWDPVVRDGTGELVVSCDTTEWPVVVKVGQEGEFDVLLENADVPERPGDDDPEVAAIMQRFRPALPTARSLSARPVSAPQLGE